MRSIVDIRDLMPCEPEPRYHTLSHYVGLWRKSGSLMEADLQDGIPSIVEYRKTKFILNGNQRCIYYFINGIWRIEANVGHGPNGTILEVIKGKLNALGINNLRDLVNKVEHPDRFKVSSFVV
jgi:hypothetical protein